MANWLSAQLKYENSKDNIKSDGGKIDGRPFHQVRQELTSCCTKRWPPVNDAVDLEYSYGLGTRAGAYRQYQKYSHAGSFGGYSSYVYFLPNANNEKIGIFVAVNGGSDPYGAMRKIIYNTFDTLLGIKTTQSNTVKSVASTVSISNKMNIIQHSSESNKNVAVDFNGYNPSDLIQHHDSLVGKWHHPLIGSTIIEQAKRRSCSTGELYDTLKIKIGKLGIGWIENLFFHKSDNDIYGYPISISPDESIDCCHGTCKNVPKIIPGVYHILTNETEAPNRMKYIDFIWDSSVWYVSDYDPVFSFEEDDNHKIKNFRMKKTLNGKWYTFEKEPQDDQSNGVELWEDTCELNCDIRKSIGHTFSTNLILILLFTFM